MRLPDPTPAEPAEVDLSTCSREPIQIPGSIQPYGMLLVLDDAGLIQQAADAPQCGISASDLLGKSAADLLGVDNPELAAAGLEPVYAGVVTLGEGSYSLVVHRSGCLVIAELESTSETEQGSFEQLYPVVRSFLAQVDQAAGLDGLGELAAREVRRLSGFDRTMIYRFDEDWNGTVIAEDRNDELPSYLDLRFPASDIPAQARELYRRNKLRLIADADYVPVPLEPRLNPTTDRPVDLSLAMLRSVSPVHLQYMRNMETWASMSISLIVEGRLWGLISCHNRVAKRVSYHVRTACEFLGQILSLQVGAREHASVAHMRVERRQIHSKLLSRVARVPAFAEALQENADELLAITGANGAAILFEGECRLIGDTPDEEVVLAIGDWLSRRSPREDLFQTDHLAGEMPGADKWASVASGLLAVSISQIKAGYVVWFRPEVVQTVRWGGDPHKPAQPAGGRLSPRKSFDAWRETVRERALPWTDLDREMAMELRVSIVDIVLRRAEEMAALNEQLVRSNKELEAFSYSVSHDLRAPFRHIVGYSELLLDSAKERLDERDRRYLGTIVDSAQAAGQLVDSLLNFSQMGRSSLGSGPVNMNLLVADARQRLALEIGARNVEWRIGELPVVHGDVTMLQQVIHNLLSNAVKFTSDRSAAVIGVEYWRDGDEEVFAVRDNGCGFDMAYVDKLFGVFQRLHHSDEFEGTGIGLANVRRVIDRHGGRTWAEGTPGKGAAFFFTLPIQDER